MENLLALYEERLQQLSQTFLHLLRSFESSHIFITPQTQQLRTQYLAEVIEKTLRNDQEKLIRKLTEQVRRLTEELSSKKYINSSYRFDEKSSLKSTMYASSEESISLDRGGGSAYSKKESPNHLQDQSTLSIELMQGFKYLKVARK